MGGFLSEKFLDNSFLREKRGEQGKSRIKIQGIEWSGQRVTVP